MPNNDREINQAEKSEDSVLATKENIVRQASHERCAQNYQSKIKEPPDGGYGWVVVFAACLVHTLFIGFVKSFSILFLEMRRKFPEQSAYSLSYVPALLTTFFPVFGKYFSFFYCLETKTCIFVSRHFKFSVCTNEKVFVAEIRCTKTIDAKYHN